LDFGDATVNLDTTDLAALGLSARYVAFLGAWKAGNDLRQCMSSSAFYRLRKQLRELTGYDIALRCPKSNVVPLRRLVMATPAARPQWADALTEALASAA
jgi:II/X family phage/plasmid replication protein